MQPQPNSHQATNLTSCRALTLSQVLTRVPFGRTTLYGGIKDGWFPPGRKPRGKRFWLETEIDEFLNNWGYADKKI